jgi:hypothetical protein
MNRVNFSDCVGRGFLISTGSLAALMCGALLSASPVKADPPIASLPQLMQLNRANQERLRDIRQSPATEEEVSEPVPYSVRRQRDRQQQSEQRVLQESQRRELLLLNRRARAAGPPYGPSRLDGIGRQRQFQLEQQHQLNRFRMQSRGARGAPPVTAPTGVSRPLPIPRALTR